MIRVKDGWKALLELLEPYRRAVYEYNEKIRGSGYYLRPFHVVCRGRKRYIYIGRYWYRVEYRGRRGTTSLVRWIYVGSRKPDPNLPDPPSCPLDGLKVVVEGGDLVVDAEAYERLVKIGFRPSP